MFVAGLGGDAARFCGRVEIGQRGQPEDPRDAVTGAPAPVRVLEVIGERPGLAFGETELLEFLVGVQAETSGSDLTMPTPCSRFVPAMVSARRTIAWETSASGSTTTMASPSSA
jgi:hypothetical protein